LQRRPDVLQRSISQLRGLGEVRTIPTTGPDTAGALAEREISEGARLIVAFGGDGTIHEVANGMIGSNVPLAPLPGGTANVLCVEIGLGTNPVRAADRLTHHAEPVRIAVGRMRRADGFVRYFLMMAGIGFDAIVLHAVHRGWKAQTGKMAYWMSGLSVLGRSLPQFETEIGGTATRRSFALATRVRNYGGDFEIARRVTLLDPLFETVLFEGDHSLRYLTYLAGVVAGKVEAVPGVAVLPATAMSCLPCNGERVPLQLDGELVGYLPAQFDIVPDALTVLLPSKYVQRARESRWTTSPIPS
jgi:diacylglycerol kinase family enzyme